jgi:DNA-binding NarL/FixJ family response regulator
MSAGKPKPTRVLVVDDQVLVRTGFRMIINAEADLEVVAEAADGVEALEEAARCRPDVVLMDIRMPRLDGVDATRRLLGEPKRVEEAQPAVSPADGELPKVVILTTFDLDEYVFDALRAGASGFLLKDVPPEDLVDAIRVVAGGDALLSPSITRRLIDRFARLPATGPKGSATAPGVELLTERELEVFGLIARGMSNAEIAESLYVSETTVKTHVGRVLMKLHLRDRVQVVVLAYESGLVQPGG